LITYKDILIPDRFRESTIHREFLADETESDRARIVFSSPFRRLQQKAQVFSLEHNSAVRTRLTHTLEVAHLGRSIAKKILFGLDKETKNSLGLENIDKEQSFIDIVETACLMHDIGNPPFGHFGEQAIKKWFKKNIHSDLNKSLKSQLKDNEDLIKQNKAIFTQDLEPDFIEFDGNAQGFRIVTKLQWNRDECGLNLTVTQIAALLKYLNSPKELKKDKKISKKPGYFFCEKPTFDKIWEKLKLLPTQRHPLNIIMEAADDIAYCLSDIEDGIEKGIINHAFFIEKSTEEWKNILSKYKVNDEFYLSIIEKTKKNYPQNRFYFNFKIALTTKLINYAAQQYIKLQDNILKGSEQCSLFDNKSPESLSLLALKSFARKYLFTTKEAENIELAGYSIITGLLDKLRILLQYSMDDFQLVLKDEFKTSLGYDTDLERRLVHKLPKKYIELYRYCIKELTNYEANCKYAYEWYYRAHLIVDYLSGMTDNFALELYQLLMGIKVGD